ncbi:MAG: flavodoxin family protein [Clostridiaceae bacterium]
MKVSLIHGQSHKGSSYNISRQILDKLPAEDMELSEFFLPKDGPGYCVGCYRCFKEGESCCPDSGKVQAIAKAMAASDVIIIDSPNYCMGMTGQLKTLFDHLAYMWMSHRPEKEMFSKVAIAVSATAGAGAKNVTKDIAQQLFWMGVPKVYRYGSRVSAMSWDEVPEKIKRKIEKDTARIASKAGAAAGKARPGLRLKFMFRIMRMNQKSNQWNRADRNHWKDNGWLEGKNPW